MSLNLTPQAERIHIGFFGRRNAGKSSLVNALTDQAVSVVSDVAGTTTDPVKKSMELLPLGPVTVIDTPGFDDVGELGEKRVKTTRDILDSIHIAVLVIDASRGEGDTEKELEEIIRSKSVPLLKVYNKQDLAKSAVDGIAVSALNKSGIEELKAALGAMAPKKKEKRLLDGIVKAGDLVVLVTPIDESAPKGRIILPQQMTIRDLLDFGASAVVCQPKQLEATLERLKADPDLVITDSQAFAEVNAIVPKRVPLTSFSILMARIKGLLNSSVAGAYVLDTLKDGDTVLISEGCTHHRQCNDIGTVKLPKLIQKHTHANINFEFSSGGSFPEDLTKYALVIHCGGCMLNDTEMKNRVQIAREQNVPITNYGIAIAHMNGILERSIEILNF